uniref:Uncharacterized protein n=1 Tax=Arundo donax TaxID=35708 RepID=A0A0A8ZPA5_ARUDO
MELGSTYLRNCGSMLL